MITKEQALVANEFHYGRCKRTVGPRGGVTVSIQSWRRNGQTKLWKTRPDEFVLPIKYGLRTCSFISILSAPEFHTAESCPLNEPKEIFRG